MQKTDIEEWEAIGEKVKEVDREVTELVTLLNSVPKTVWREEHDKAYDGMSELKSVLESRMFNEHPEEAEAETFYGRRDP